jgi:hypothetical protein
MLKCTLLGACLLAASLSASVVHALDVKSTVITGSSTVDVGDRVTLRYTTDGFPDFSGADLLLTFDDTVLTLDDVVFGDFSLASFMDPPAGSAVAGHGANKVLMFSRFFAPPVQGDVFLFDLEFTGAGPGTSAVSLMESPTAPFALGTALSGFTPLTDDVAFDAQSVTVGQAAVIPLPLPAALLLTGLGAIVAVRRRQAS